MGRRKSHSSSHPYQVTARVRPRTEAREKGVLNVSVFRYVLTYFATTKINQP